MEFAFDTIYRGGVTLPSVFFQAHERAGASLGLMTNIADSTINNLIHIAL